jgi:hypothetical protein
VKPDILQLGPDELLQVIKPLYGLSDSGDYWGKTLNYHHKSELQMSQITGDFSFFYKRLMGNLVGISGTYVDDIIRTGNKTFREEYTKCTHQTFDAKPESETPLNFTGLHIGGPKFCRKISQIRYIDSLNVLPTSADFEAFRSMRAKLLGFPTQDLILLLLWRSHQKSRHRRLLQILTSY